MSMEQIARDIANGSFPEKSAATLREEAIIKIVIDVLKSSAPGISEAIRLGIARSITMRVEASKPRAAAKEIERLSTPEPTDEMVTAYMMAEWAEVKKSVEKTTGLLEPRDVCRIALTAALAASRPLVEEGDE